MNRDVLEKAIINCMIIDDNSCEYAISELTPHHFTYHTGLFLKVRKLKTENETVDVTALMAAGVKLEYLNEMIKQVTSSSQINVYTKQLKSIHFSDRVDAYAQDLANCKTVEDKRVMLANAPVYDIEAEKHRTTKEMTQATLHGIGKRHKQVDDIKGIRTYFDVFDDLTGGLKRGGTTLVDGDTNIGKSLFAEALVVNVAENERGSHYYAYEMDNDAVIERMLSMKAHIPIKDINRPRQNWTKKDTQKVKHFDDSPVIKYTSFFANEMVENTFEEFKQKCNAEILRTGIIPDIIVLDYIELMTGPGKNDLEIVMGIYAKVKRYAKKLKQSNIVIIMSRNKEGQTSGSNKLRFHVDLHIKLDPDPEAPTLIKCQVVKNRTGGKGYIEFAFIPEMLQMKEIPKTVGGWKGV